jgi:hypothetical protein
MSLRRAAAGAALCLAGCTFDYDGILEGAEESVASGAAAGGGEDPASNASSAAASTTSSGATTTSASSASGSSGSTTTTSGAGAGGAGEGGSGSGGAAEGGGGGDGPLDLPPCPGIALDFEQRDLGRALGAAWEVIGNQEAVSLDTGDGELDVDVDGDVNAGIRTVAAVLRECSITVTLVDLDPFADSSDTITVTLNATVAEMHVATAMGVSPYCDIITGIEPTGDCLDSGGALELRVRHTGTEICFDFANLGETPQPTGDCVASTDAQKVSITVSSVGSAEATFDDVR